MSGTAQNAPELRLSGFEGEWVGKPLGESFSERVQSDENGELLSVTVRTGVRKFSEIGRHDTSNADKSKYKLVEVGDIAYNSMRMWQGASGRSPYRGIVSPAYTVLVPAEGVVSGFFARLFKTAEMIALFERNSQGLTSDTWNLKYPALSKIEAISPDKPEQAAISSTFDNLEALISASEVRHEALQHLRQTMLVKMFPQGDAGEPEIRFDGFEGEWESKPLQQCFSERVQFDGLGELLSVSIASGVKKFSETGRRDTSNADKSNYKLVEVDDIAYNSMRMWQGASGRSPYRGIVSPAYTVLTPSRDAHSGFFARLFKNPEVIEVFRRSSQGISSDTWNLKYAALSCIEVRSPSIGEQRMISEMFDRLDDLIEAESIKVEKLRHLKSALLEKMFV